MEPIVTLYEREHVPVDTLPSELATLYGGGFALPELIQQDRPYMIANFVETIDGVVSYNASGQLGGGAVSGDNKQDQMVMGLLRAYADAVIIGTSSLREDANHLHIPATISPDYADVYAKIRTRLGKQETLPISVIMSASGAVNFEDKTFHTQGLRVVIATTEEGQTAISKKTLPQGVDVRVIEHHTLSESSVSPAAVLALLTREYGVRIALYEGGPHLLSSFLKAHLIDELFVTVAPHLAGHSQATHRFSLVEGHAFQPEQLWTTLMSVKLAGSYLLLRYKFTK
jgi:riboflavin biosynthesis pyrimidine reductase